MIPIFIGQQQKKPTQQKAPPQIQVASTPSTSSYQYEYQYEYDYQYKAKVQESSNMSQNDGDGSGGFAFGLASKAGSMGARMGKKVAQSETGRRATRAAVKGACDGVRDDMLSKYSDPVPTTPTSPSSKEPSGGHHKKEEKTNNVPTWMDSDDSDEGGHMTAKTHRYHEARPPKPSLKDKFKLNMNFGRSEPQKQAPRRVRKDPKDRIYNSRLAKEPDWDKLLRVQAMYNFVGEMNCDLQFRKGQVIKVITRTESHNDWWEGQLDDRVGIFPANYVKTLS